MNNFDTEKFINEVQNRPWLWDTSVADYSNREVKKKGWEELVNIFGGTELSVTNKRELGQTLQKRWKSIRGCFTREVKRQKEVKSGSAAGSRKSEYQYFKQLQFLQKVVAVRDISEEPAEDLQHDEETADRWQRAKRSKKRHKITDPEDDPCIKARNNSIEKMEQLERAEEDEDRMFLLSLLGPLKSVPQEKKMTTKIKIMTIVNEATQVDNYTHKSEVPT
ncbi:uncharacterized protein [Tenebrio molitor]|uniref:uncharacterized protein n=1 Tax=Tenebrio molitor TaxID=7067 RepID=UPI003624741B